MSSAEKRNGLKILVIGGSYFLGKHFVRLAADGNEITVFNRGNRPLGISGVKEVIGDRNSKEDLDKLKSMDFDTVVDFCAYNAGDISEIIGAIGQKLKQYVFISTADVYKKGTNRILDETAPLDTTVYAGEVGQYIAGKVVLENELKTSCVANNIAYTSVRPAIIYGPDNYAPREGIYFNWIEKARQVLAPADESGYFQMIYVDDLAAVIASLCANENYYNKAVNACGAKTYNYSDFLTALKTGCGVEFQVIGVPVADIVAKGIALPFPLTKEESEEYTSIYEEIRDKIKTDLGEGLKKTYEYFINM